MNECITPVTSEQFQAYYLLRWQLLRQPWGKVQGSEQDELEQQSFHRMIVNPQGQVIAVGRLHKTGQAEAQIRYMAVSDLMQGQGLGKQMIAAMEQVARQHGVTSISLNARENALAFYLASGYQQHGFSHVLYDEITHIKMTKQLCADQQHQQCLAMQLQSTWHQTIPMSQAMNIEVCFYDRNTLVTTCDPVFNKNLHNTMFAGSIYTLATLTGWGWVYMQLKHYQLDGDIVLADGHIRYHQPVKGPAYASTKTMDVDTKDKKDNMQLLTTGKKPRFKVQVSIACGDKIAATFNGLYVVLPKKEESTDETK
jgi:thioesterase domain-containing protein